MRATYAQVYCSKGLTLKNIDRRLRSRRTNGVKARMLADGVYTMHEVARYTKVPANTVRNWFLNRSDGRGKGPVFVSDYARVGDDFAVSFLNLIEAYVASKLREKNVKPPIIRSAHQMLQGRLNTRHPFAHADLRAFDGRVIEWLNRGSMIRDAITGQQLMEYIVPHLERITYGHTTKLAEEWGIAQGVVIRPNVGFGKPVVERTGVSTRIIANQYRANDENAALVARLFHIPESGVLDAVAFEKAA